ncbi:hypothetical protein AB4K20DRAFT_1910662 [Rhizopus microsporus]
MNSPCVQEQQPQKHFIPQAEDILTDEDLLELFRIIKLIVRKKPDTERIAKLYFCIVYALGDQYPFHKPAHGDHIIFRDEFMTGHVQLPFSAFCTCPERAESTQQQQQQQQKQLSVSYLTNPSSSLAPLPRLISKSEEIMTDRYSVRPYTHIRPNTTINNITTTATTTWSPEPIHSHRSSESSPGIDVVMEPKQRGFYYEDGRITREPPLLQRYAEQGVLTQASLLRKRKKHTPDLDYHELSVLPPKKPKIPHRHGEFKQRRDDIISRMRTVMITDLEQKAQRLPEDFSLAIEQVSLPDDLDADQLNADEAGRLLMPALMILTHHSNMKPHLDNGMNQNGIYYNNDYFRLYLAFVQFQNIFARLFPNEIIKIATPSSLEDEAESPVSERDKDRERNVNMKAYRVWIEPRLTETNWAAFRRNVMVGERMMQLTKVVGQGVLLMTKELSGSKLHLTFTNNEWDEFIQGLSQGKWDETIDWSHEDQEKMQGDSESRLVNELRYKFDTHFWFTDQGTLVSPAERRAARAQEKEKRLKKARNAAL